MNAKRYLLLPFLALGLLLTIWLRTPFLKEGSPYLYREDEAHHFNRIVNMMKSGDLNPHYFHKPSLHFYLRLPLMSAAYLWAVKKGELNNLKDIVTSDPFGVADYSFSASHPRLLLVNRAFSLLLQLGSILLTYLICRHFISSRWISLISVILFAISPAAIYESSVIGVDCVMTFFCLLTVVLGLRAFDLKTNLALFWCALSAGLAVSSKYNALPVVFVPMLLAFYIRPITLERCLIAGVVPLLAFILASPYIIISMPEFLNQLAYEIWHYGVAGHVGHMAEPGFPQVKFYSIWLAKDGLGLIASSLALCGLIITLTKLKTPKLQVMIVFPLTFFLLMIAQKTNFERNMTVIIPFVSIFAAYAFMQLSKIIPSKVIFVVVLVALIQPFALALEVRNKAASIPESRLLVSPQIQTLSTQGKELALDGRLQFNRKLLELPGVSRTDFTKASVLKAFQEGFDYLVIHPSDKEKMLSRGLYEEESNFEGNLELQRIVQNPAIALLRRKSNIDTSQIDEIAQKLSPITLRFIEPKSTISFEHEAEGQLWIKNSVESFVISSTNKDSTARTLSLKLFSPWPDQHLTFYVDSLVRELDLNGEPQSEVIFQLNPSKIEHLIIVKSTRVHSPKALGISSDTRRLAFAIKSATLN